MAQAQAKTGRLEHTERNQAAARQMLTEMPSVISDYYYRISVDSESTTGLEYMRKLHRFLTWYATQTGMEVKAVDVAAIRESDITRYLAECRTYTDREGNTRQTAFSTQKQNFAILHGFFEYLAQEHITERNLMEYMHAPKNYDHRERKVITEGDVAGMVNASRHGAGNDLAISRQATWRERDAAIMMLFVNTGMRKTALTEINLEDLDGDTLKVVDKRSKTHVYKLNDATRAALDAWLKRRNELMDGYADCAALFISNRRTRISGNAVDEIVRKYSAAVYGEENGISPHKLRGAFVTILHEKTGDIEFVRRAVGHSNVSTTQRYIADDGSSKERASEIMGSIFSAAG